MWQARLDHGINTSERRLEGQRFEWNAENADWHRGLRIGLNVARWWSGRRWLLKVENPSPARKQLTGTRDVFSYPHCCNRNATRGRTLMGPFTSTTGGRVLRSDLVGA